MTRVGAAAPRDVDAIVREIEGRREEITALVSELNRRRHALTDVRLQIRRHAVGATAGVLSVGLGVAGAVAYRRWRVRRRDTWRARGGRLRAALGRMIDRPERVATEPTVTQRILAAAGSALVAVVIKAAAERLGGSRRS